MHDSEVHIDKKQSHAASFKHYWRVKLAIRYLQVFGHKLNIIVNDNR
jgi:hypothetical protein